MCNTQLRGIPPSLVRGLTAETSQQTIALQNSAIGNGFHMPSLMLALVILLQLVTVGEAISPYLGLMDVEEQALRSRISHTAFDPQVVKAFPGTLSQRAITASMKLQLSVLPASHAAWACTGGWDPDDIRLLQTFLDSSEAARARRA